MKSPPSCDIFKFIFYHEICCPFIQMSPIFVFNGPNNNKPALVGILAWHCTNDGLVYWRLYDPLGLDVLNAH